MGITGLRELLKSVCNDSPWLYAAFWKLRHGNPMILIWQDGYCDYSKLQKSPESGDDTCSNFGSAIFSAQFETGASNFSSEAYSIGRAVTDMTNFQCALGEGIIGKVALLGNHMWVSFNDILTGEVNPELISECPDEWLLQFAFGIKAILLIPMLPHGVLQLGSLEEGAKDTEMVNYLKDRFDCLHSAEVNTVISSLKKDFLAQVPHSQISSPMGDLNGPSSISLRHVFSDDLDFPEAVNGLKLNEDQCSTLCQGIPFLTLQDQFRPDGKDLQEAFEYGFQDNVDIASIGIGVSTPSESIDTNQLEIAESKLSELSCLVEELQAHVECSDFVGLFQQSLSGIESNYSAVDMTKEVFQQSPPGATSSYSAVDMTKQPSGGMADDDMDHEIVSRSLSFPKDCELHKALGPVFWGHTGENFRSTSILNENGCSSSGLTCNKDPSEKTEPSTFFEAAEAEYSLEAVVADAYNVSGNTSSDETNSFKSSKCSPNQFAASSLLQSQFKASAWMGNNLVQGNHSSAPCTAVGRDANPTSDDLKSIASKISVKERHESENIYMKHLKEQNSSNVSSKRKARPGNNRRPRPRDRQLIQDRVNVLRELVPNGEKCSIDGLLDRTVKHILYLRSLTGRAEKLRQWVHQEVAARRSYRSTDLKDNSESGASWALEFGIEFQICPIVVEDLPHPGHLLVEMLCNEYVLFLEIANVLRGLDLTILSGAIENRSNNTWAHFIVEASKGFHRLDIFWPLMQLLRGKRKPISSKI